MSRYFIHESKINWDKPITAGRKARVDVEVILDSLGFQALEVIESDSFNSMPDTWQKIYHRLAAKGDWQRALNAVQPGDTLLLQSPFFCHSIQAVQYLCELVSSKNIELILLIHDLETFRDAKVTTTKTIRRKEILNEERSLLRSCSKLILPNEQMRMAVKTQFGSDIYNKSVSLELWDYLMREAQMIPPVSKHEGVIIAANLKETKAGYAYHLPEDTQFNLYGVNYTGNSTQNITYRGAFPSDDLPAKMIGSFGLVWNGASPSSCNEAHGEYLRICNPHKASLYLACGIPIIIWDIAALAPYVIEHGVGITISDLHDINSAIDEITDDEYKQMQQNAQEIGKKVRNGDFLRAALAQIGIKSENE